MRITFNARQFSRHRTRTEANFRGVNGDFRDVVRATAAQVKADWARAWGPTRHLPALGASVTFDTAHSGPVHTAEIGPDKLRRQGPLGTLIEDANGGARNRATHAGLKAGRRGETRLVDAASRAAEKGVGG